MIEPAPISRWLWLFSGFQQSMLALSGCETVWRRIRNYSTPDMCIQFREWNTDPKVIAEFVVRNSYRQMPTRVVIGGYSWGGDLAIDLCKELNKHEVAVEELITCDAVFRSGLFSTRFPFNPLSMTSLPKFEIPDNVARVTAFAQTNNRPSGHRLFRTDGSEIARTMVDCVHAEIDECDGFSAAMDAAAQRLAA